MNVLHIVINFRTLLFRKLFCELESKGLMQTVYYPFYKGKMENYNFKSKNITLVQSGILNFITRLFYGVKLFVIYQDIQKKLIPSKFNIIHAHTLFSDGGISYLLNKKYKIPYIVTIRNTDINFFLKYKPWLKYFGYRILKESKIIICVSSSYEQSLNKIYRGKFKDKIIVVPNGIHNTYFSTNAPSKSDYQDPLKLLFVGSFNQNKNLKRVINFAYRNNYSLMLIGGEMDTDDIPFEFRERVKQLGKIDDPLLLTKYYREADIFILPSKKETFGLVYIEAMSQGTPVIYSKDTGIDGMFPYGDVGYAVDPFKPREWDVEVNRILNNYAEISDNCIMQSKKFNWDDISERYLELYKEKAD